jgi:hypothetical protein
MECGDWKSSGLGFHYELFMYLTSVAIDKQILLKISTAGHINITGNFRIYDVVCLSPAPSFFISRKPGAQ